MFKTLVPGILLSACLFSFTACREASGVPAQQGTEIPPDSTTGGGTGGNGGGDNGGSQTPDSVGTVVVDSFETQALGVSKHYLVYLPPSYSTSGTRRYPVAYFLHGTEATERAWVDDMHLDHVLDSLAKAKVPEMIVVMVDGDNSFYHSWVSTPNYGACLNRGSIDGQPAATYCVKTAAYDTYIVHDLVQHIDSSYRTMATSRHRGIAGLSMGGMGAIALTLRYPNVFGAASSLSGAILSLLDWGNGPATSADQLREHYGAVWTDYQFDQEFGSNLDTWRTYDPLSIASAMIAAHKTFPPIWMIVGKDDGEALDGNRRLHQVLLNGSVSHTYSETSGSHNVAFWSAHAGEASAWLATQIEP
jgi:S-formylglutathione hydrolase FrmB